MNYSDYRLSLDIHDEDSGQSLNVKRGDNKSRRIYITLRDGSQPYHISEDCYAVFAATKPDGKILYNSCTISDCTIQYEMTGQTTNVAGVTECEIRLYGADNQLITSPRFLLIVDETVYDDERVLDSSDEFTALTELINRGIEMIGDYEEVIKQMTILRDEMQETADQIETKIDSKADGLHFDKATSLLYLTSNGQIIGTGVQVAGGDGPGGSGTLMYTPSLKNLMESRVFTVSEGTKVELRFSYTSVDDEGIDDGPGIGRLLVNKVARDTFSLTQGINTKDVTAYLAAGANSIQIQAENSEGAVATLPYTITVAAAYLASNFDASVVFDGPIPFVYTPTGIADKTIHFELDDEEIGTTVVTTSGRQQPYTIPAQQHGSHSLNVWFECDIDGATVKSNTLHFTLICVEQGNTTPIVAVNNQLMGSVEQYSNIVTKYRVYDPVNMSAAITLEVDGEVVHNLTVDRTEQTWNYRPTAVGHMTQTIRCGEEYVSWTQTVTESKINVEAETSALALHLSSYGRSNAEENPGTWESGNIACQFQEFNFVSDGWLQDEEDTTVLRITGDARLHIPYKIFSYDFRTTGKTIEFEMATREVLNYDTEVINCFSGGRGFTITAQQLMLASEESKLGTRYKEDEHIRVTFVVEKRNETRLILSYINGIMSGAVQYPENDDFSQFEPVGITIGSNECTTDLYNIRVYDNNLTRYQVLDNWIADTQNAEERMQRYLRNQIYDAYGRVVISQLPHDLCYLVIQCPTLPQFKDDEKTCSGYFVDLVHPERSFTFQNAKIDVQGTSSQYYYRKNYKIKFKNGFILYDGSKAEVYQMNEDAVPTSTFTMKADVASSEGAFNVVLSMLYNDLCPYKTPAQLADPKVRQTIEGFPMVIFWDNGSETSFLGKYNFNNDKGTPEVFGFQDGDESWETLQNGTDRVGWHSADFSSGWETDFEARHPKDNKNITRLQQLAQWLVSTDTDQATDETIPAVTYGGVEYTKDTAEYRLAKFSAELADHFVEEAIIFYYLFTEMFLSIDQREKNAFPTYIASLDRWIVLFYDADSSCGTDNKGNLSFDYYLEDIDYTEAGDPVYNGQNSVLWKNLRQTRHDEIMAMYQGFRTGDQVSYETVNAMFENHQSKWPEAIFNEDMYIKCLEPLIKSGDGLYLPMLQGKKEMWIKWWLYNRFRYLDSKYVTGTSMENRITIRAHQKASVWLKSYVNMYGHVYFNAAHVENRMERNKEYEFQWPASGAEDPVIGINDADLLTSLGDLSPLMVELIDVSGAPHITDLKLGDKSAGYKNYSLNSITLGNNILLRTIDLRNCVNLTQSVNASGCTNIEEVYCSGTAVTSVSLPNGGILKTLHLPDTVTNLTVRNQKMLDDFYISSYDQISTLRVENTPSIPVLDIVNSMVDNSRVRIIGMDIEATGGGQIDRFLKKLETMRGLDENGNNVEKAQVSGKIHTRSVTAAVIARIAAAMETYPELEITYDDIRNPIVRFYNGDKLLQTIENVPVGSEVQYTGTTPTKPDAEVPEDWVFSGWSPKPVNVEGDLDCYAQFAFVGLNTYKLLQRTLSGAYENDRVKVVGAYAFYGNTKLESISMDAVTSVESEGFRNCTKLVNAHLPSAASLKDSSFNTCTLLERVDCSATYVGITSFYNDPALATLILRNTDTVAELYNTGVFYNTPIAKGTGYIYVPAELVDSYKAATNWSSFADQIRAIEDYPDICGGA